MNSVSLDDIIQNKIQPTTVFYKKEDEQHDDSNSSNKNNSDDVINQIYFLKVDVQGTNRWYFPV